MNLPDIENLRCFVAAARELNFRAAARAVALTPAALGQRIRQLEEQLDTKLFERTTRSVALTQAGLSLLGPAQVCLDRAADCVQAARGELTPPPMDLILGTRHELGMSWVLPQLSVLEAAFPNITFHLYFGSGPDLVLRVRTGEIDCAVTSTRISDPKIDAVRLHAEEYVFVAARDLLKREPLSKPAHAANHVLLDVTAELPLFQYWRDAPGGGDRLQFRSHRIMGTIASVREVVIGGAGVAVLPRYLIQEDLKQKRLVELFPTAKPNSDYFRLIFRANDPRRSIFQNLAATMLKTDLR